MARKFKWNMWNYDCDGNAYIIAADECPNRADVPFYIVKEDGLSETVLDPSLGECLCADIVEEGWCKFQVRTDWEDMEGKRHGWYVVEKAPHNSPIFRGKRGWFPVWIIRLGEWY